ncbi:MAG: DUF2167 domain-containing protein [Verrucomicrobiaceae bacterium]|nr:MAG: DUF2167 domain-containing protein [Verrucomicrobiaceae bacterium]
MKILLSSAFCLLSISTLLNAQKTSDAPAVERTAAPEAGSAKDEAPAVESSADSLEREQQAAVEKFLKSLHFMTGTQTLANGVVTLDLPEGFRFLNGADARRVLVNLWGNPPNTASEALGMILPPGGELTDDESWAVIVSYDKSGYVSDEDAAEMDYQDLLKKMKKGDDVDNEERKKAGYSTMTLKGWALPPHYDHDTKVLHWAKELEVEGNPENTLNYDVRVLGRKGVVSLNCVAGMAQLEKVKSRTPELVSMTKFNSGHAYADFNPKTDEKAAYGIAGLIAGSAIAAKTGLFKGIWLAILAGKKFILLGVLAVGGLLKKLFSRRGEQA